MPKNSSKSKDWVSGRDVVSQPRFSKIVIIGLVVLLLAAAGIFVFWRPKALAVEQIVPSGALVFLRADHVQEHLSELRASGFWKGFSKVNVPKVLEHAQLQTKAIQRYNAWRDRAVGVIDHPLFKQMFGHEVALAVYKPTKSINPHDWTSYLSGALMVTRIDAKTRVAESLAGIWSQGSTEWSLEQRHYKNNTITAVYFKKAGLTVYYTRLRDLLVFSLNENLVASSIDTTRHKNLSLSQDEDFNVLAQDFYAQPDGMAYIRLNALQPIISETLARLMPAADSSSQEAHEKTKDADDQPSSLQNFREAMDRLRGVKSAGLSLSVGRPLKFKWQILLDPAQRPAGDRHCAPGENAILNLIPKDATLYHWDNCLDAKGAYERLQESLKAQAGNHDPASTEPFVQLEKTWGFTVEKDILPVLGRQIGWYMQSVDVKGLFPIPKAVLFVQVNDEKKAGDLLKRIATTPVTLIQHETYDGTEIHFVSIPLFTSFRPSYAFTNGFALMATSDDLLKASLDAYKNPLLSLKDQSFYKDLSGKLPAIGNAMSYLDVAQAARQGRSFIDWASRWFTLKVNQTDSEVESARRNIENLQKSLQSKTGELKASEDKLSALRKEEYSLKAAYDAGALTAEATNTLSQPGQVISPNGAARPSLEEVNLKTAQVAAVELDAASIRRDMEDLESQRTDLEDDIEDFLEQKKETQNLQYYVDGVIVPFLQGMESLAGAMSQTTFYDDKIESEMFLKAE